MMRCRKGQHLAIETVLSLAISIIVATAVITAFNSYSDTVMDSIHERHATEIQAQVLTAVYNLRTVDSGSGIEVEIPETQGGDYRVSFEQDQLVIEVEEKEFIKEINNVGWASGFDGSVERSNFKIMKLEDRIVLRT